MADSYENYDAECRFANWKCEYQNLLENLKVIDVGSIQVKEPSDIFLEDLAYQLHVWENTCENYKSEHKTSVFHDYQDIKSKLLIRLDSIDVSSDPNRQANRSKLYDRLFDLTARFERKIHPDHSTCTECEQVKVVMIKL